MLDEIAGNDAPFGGRQLLPLGPELVDDTDERT